MKDTGTSAAEDSKGLETGFSEKMSSWSGGIARMDL